MDIMEDGKWSVCEVKGNVVFVYPVVRYVRFLCNIIKKVCACG